MSIQTLLSPNLENLFCNSITTNVPVNGNTGPTGPTGPTGTISSNFVTTANAVIFENTTNNGLTGTGNALLNASGNMTVNALTSNTNTFSGGKNFLGVINNTAGSTGTVAGGQFMSIYAIYDGATNTILKQSGGIATAARTSAGIYAFTLTAGATYSTGQLYVFVTPYNSNVLTQKIVADCGDNGSGASFTVRLYDLTGTLVDARISIVVSGVF